MRNADRQRLVLVVEDDRQVSGRIGDLLSEEGFQVIETTSAQAALRIARQHQPDAIVLDLILPDGSGLDVLEGVKRRSDTRDIPVLAISGAHELLEDPASVRADAVLPKPVGLDRLPSLVRRFTEPEVAPLTRRVRPAAHDPAP